MSTAKKCYNRNNVIALVMGIVLGMFSFITLCVEVGISAHLGFYTLGVYWEVASYDRSGGYDTDAPGYQEAYDKAYLASLEKRHALEDSLSPKLRAFAKMPTWIKVWEMSKQCFLLLCAGYLILLTKSKGYIVYSKRIAESQKKKENHIVKCYNRRDFLKEYDVPM